MEYFIKHGVSESGVEELDYVLDGFGIQKDFKGIHDKCYNAVIQESSMAKLSIPIRYCPKCHKLIRTKNVDEADSVYNRIVWFSEFSKTHRNCLGIIEEAINREGKEGFYLINEGVLYHYYYGIHCHCCGLIGTMQLYDRSSCGTGNNPCFQYNGAVGVYNPIVNRYTYPEHNIAKATSYIKSFGRFATHFDTGSI